MSLTKEQIAVRGQWVEALRSGKYRQGREMLRTLNGGMCCLGVLCEVLEPGCFEVGAVSPGAGSPPPRIKKRAALHKPLVESLWVLNDSGELPRSEDRDPDRPTLPHHSFLEIADTIELLTLAGE